MCKVWKHEWAFYLNVTQWLREIVMGTKLYYDSVAIHNNDSCGVTLAQVRWSILMQREHIDDDDNDDDDDHYSDDEDDDDDDDARFHGVAV